MATPAPSTPLRRRVYSEDGGVVRSPRRSPQNLKSSAGRSPESHSHHLHHLQPSSDIPRSYSGLFGAGVGTGNPPPIPTEFSDDDEGDTNLVPPSVVRRRSRAATDDPPPSASSSMLAGPTDHNHHQRHHHPKHSQPHHYRAGSDLLPFELSRNRNTDWISAGGPALLWTYLLFILVFLLTALAFLDPRWAWTATNLIHGAWTMMYLHWIKGNPADYMDGTQGEMNAMTLWEQIVSRPAVELHSCDKKKAANVIVGGGEGQGPRGCALTATVLCVIPTLIAHGACHFADYDTRHVFANVAAWLVVLVPKMPFMNGVRILGINRTTGIDDEGYTYDSGDETDTEGEGESLDGSGRNCDGGPGGNDDESKKDT